MATIVTDRQVASALKLQPLADGFAVEVNDIDLSRGVDHQTSTALRQALAEHKVLVFRAQNLDRAQLTAFARQFGSIFAGKRKSPVAPEDLLARLEGNIDKDGKPNGRLYDSWGLRWHSDVSWSSHPGVATMLHGITLPDQGGDTEFADMQTSFDALTPDQKAELEQMTATHNFWCVRAFRHRMAFPWARHPAGEMHNLSIKEHLFPMAPRCWSQPDFQGAAAFSGDGASSHRPQECLSRSPRLADFADVADERHQPRQQTEPPDDGGDRDIPASLAGRRSGNLGQPIAAPSADAVRHKKPTASDAATRGDSRSGSR